MILVDTSIWIDHGRRRHALLAAWLTEGLVLGHPFVQGELACGQMPRRVEVLAIPLEPVLPVALPDEEVELLGRRHRDLGMHAEIEVQPARAALLRPDHDEVRERAPRVEGLAGSGLRSRWGPCRLLVHGG